MARDGLSLNVNLLVNEAREARIYVGDPLWCSVSILNQRRVGIGESAEPTRYWVGSPNQPWPSSMRFLRKSDGEWVPLKFALRLMSKDPADPVVILGPGTSCSCEFGLDPNDVNELKPDVYLLKVLTTLVEERSNNSVELESNSALVVITGERAEEDERRIMLRSRYFLRSGDPQAALESGKMFLKLKPSSIAGLLIMGEVEEARNNLDMALTFFKKAEEQHRKQYPGLEEEPRYIIRKIIETQLKIGHRKNSGGIEEENG
jgi:hypothetical protein